MLKIYNDVEFERIEPRKLTDTKILECAETFGRNVLISRRRFGGLLPEIHRRRLWSVEGFQSLYQYAAMRAGFTRATVDRILSLDRKLEGFERLRILFETGLVGWSKLEKVTRVLTPETEEAWEERIRRMTQRAIDVLVRELLRQNQAEGVDDRQEFHSKLTVSSEVTPAAADAIGSGPESDSGPESGRDIAVNSNIACGGSNLGSGRISGMTGMSATIGSPVTTVLPDTPLTVDRPGTPNSMNMPIGKAIPAVAAFCSGENSISGGTKVKSSECSAVPGVSNAACPYCGQKRGLSVKQYRGRNMVKVHLDPLVANRLLFLLDSLSKVERQKERRTRKRYNISDAVKYALNHMSPGHLALPQYQEVIYRDPESDVLSTRTRWGSVTLRENELSERIPIGQAIDLRNERLQAKEAAATYRAHRIRLSNRNEKNSNVESDQNSIHHHRHISNKSRYIPAAVRRYIWHRNGGFCEYPGCSKPVASLHHIKRFALDDNPDPDLLRGLCRDHDLLVHSGAVANELGPAEGMTAKVDTGIATPEEAARARVDLLWHSKLISSSNEARHRRSRAEIPGASPDAARSRTEIPGASPDVESALSKI